MIFDYLHLAYLHYVALVSSKLDKKIFSQHIIHTYFEKILIMCIICSRTHLNRRTKLSTYQNIEYNKVVNTLPVVNIGSDGPDINDQEME